MMRPFRGPGPMRGPGGPMYPGRGERYRPYPGPRGPPFIPDMPPPPGCVLANCNTWSRL